MAKFNPEGEPGFSPETNRPLERGWKGEKEEEDRQRALGFIVESGRAKTPEEAEAYLMKINQLKEKLVNFLNTELLDLREVELSNQDRSNYLVGYENDDGMARKGRLENDASIMRSWNSADIEKSDPHIWSLTRGIESDSGAGRVRTDIIIRMKDRGVVSIPDQPTEDMAWRLKEYLDPEELELLKAEHVVERQALIKKLRKEADKLEKPRHAFESPFWEPLAWSKRSEAKNLGSEESD